MHYKLWAIMGLSVGLLTYFFIPGNRMAGGVGDILVAVVGAGLGGLIFKSMLDDMGGVRGRIASSGVGACVLLFLLRYLLPSVIFS